MNWIKVEDRLPENGVEVLVWGKYYYDIPCQAFIYNGVWEGSLEVTDHMDDGYVNNRVFTSGDKITHWISVPSVPKD